jgi:hypothetical protein
MPPIKKMRVAANRPDQMSAGGSLPDGFIGEVTKARFVPWNYQGKSKTVLGAAILITPDEESGFEPFTQYYSAGNIEQFQPSNDGMEPVADPTDWSGTPDDLEDYEGVYALPVGQKDQLPGGSNWGHFLESLHECGMSYEDMDADITFLEGVRGRFDRVPQRERKGIVSAPVEEGQKTFQKTILVITQLEKAAKAAGKGKAAAAKTNAKAAANGAGDEDFNERVHDAIVAALNAADGTLGKKKVAQLFLRSKDFDSAEKQAAVALLNDEDFLASAEGFAYDDEEDTLAVV